MDTTIFTAEESNIICIYAGEGKDDVIGDIVMVLPYLDDMDLKNISQSILEKLQNMTNEEYERMEFMVTG